MATDPQGHISFLARKNIGLIGYRGTGKTTVAQLLADQLHYTWVDTDDLVEQQEGKTIASIFAELGESAFRDRESEVVETVCSGTNQVIATGGGAVLRKKNRDWLKTCDAVIWLTASPETIAERIAIDPVTSQRRPQLTKLTSECEIKTLLADRHSYYEQCATMSIDTEHKSPLEIVREIVMGL